jgi:hypothetical protein
MATRRQKQSQGLRDAGFMPNEITILSKMPAYVPYKASIIAKRRQDHARFINNPKYGGHLQVANRAWYKHLDAENKRRGLVIENNPRGIKTAWNWLRHSGEDDYKKNNPHYTKDRERYPLKSHHKLSSDTARKLARSTLADAKQELKQLGENSDIPRVQTLKARIALLEGKKS